MHRREGVFEITRLCESKASSKAGMSETREFNGQCSCFSSLSLLCLLSFPFPLYSLLYGIERAPLGILTNSYA